MCIFVKLEKTVSQFRGLFVEAGIATEDNFHLVVGYESPSNLLKFIQLAQSHAVRY